MEKESSGIEVGKKKSNNTLVIVLLVFSLFANAVLAYLYLSEKEKVIVITNETVDLKTANTDLENDLKDILTQYDALKTENSQISNELLEQKAKVEALLEEAKKHKNDAYIIAKLKKEAASLRSIMQGYVHTIDSLNTANITLRQEKAEVEGKLDDQKQKTNQLEKINEGLIGKVKLGSKLKALEFTVSAQRVKSNGIHRETSHADKAEKFKCCLTIDKNEVAKKGMKNIYLRIIDPAGNVMTSSNDNIFTYNGIKGLYSIKKEIAYENEELDVCFFYDITSTLSPGIFKIEIYAEDYDLGVAELDLK